MKTLELQDNDTDASPSSPFLDHSIDLSPSILDRFSDNENLKGRLNDYYQFKIQPNLGIIFALVSQLFNSVMVLMCKILLMDKENALHPLNILVIRMSITYLLCYLYMWYYKVPDYPFGPKECRKLLLTRGCSGFLGVSTQYYSLFYLTISDTTAITFMGPTITALLAWYFLKERYSRPEALCGLISFVGVLLVARPSFIFGEVTVAGDSGELAGTGGSVGAVSDSGEVQDPMLRLIGSISAFTSCITTSISMICIRKIGFRAHPLLSVACFSLTTFVISTVAVILSPQLSIFTAPAGLKQWLLVINMGVSGFLMQFLITAGMQREKASTGMAMSYTQLCYTTFYDYYFFNHLPNLWSVVGTGFIIGSAILVIYFKDSGDGVVGGGGGYQKPINMSDYDAEAGIYENMGFELSDNQLIDTSKMFKIDDDEEEEEEVGDDTDLHSTSLHHLSSDSSRI